MSLLLSFIASYLISGVILVRGLVKSQAWLSVVGILLIWIITVSIFLPRFWL